MVNTMNHSLGPWTVKTNNAYQTSWLIFDASGNQLAQVANWQNKCRNTDGESNARLMASAPNLAEENKRLRTALENAAKLFRHGSVEWEDAANDCERALGLVPNDKDQTAEPSAPAISRDKPSACL